MSSRNRLWHFEREPGYANASDNAQPEPPDSFFTTLIRKIGQYGGNNAFQHCDISSDLSTAATGNAYGASINDTENSTVERYDFDGWQFIGGAVDVSQHHSLLDFTDDDRSGSVLISVPRPGCKFEDGGESDYFKPASNKPDSTMAEVNYSDTPGLFSRLYGRYDSNDFRFLSFHNNSNGQMRETWDANKGIKHTIWRWFDASCDGSGENSEAPVGKWHIRVSEDGQVPLKKEIACESVLSPFPCEGDCLFQVMGVPGLPTREIYTCRIPACEYTERGDKLDLIIQHINHHLQPCDTTLPIGKTERASSIPKELARFSSDSRYSPVPHTFQSLEASWSTTSQLLSTSPSPTQRSHTTSICRNAHSPHLSTSPYPPPSTPKEQASSLVCSYKDCPRSDPTRPFKRHDNLRTHLRNVHGEAISKRRGGRPVKKYK